MLSVKNQEYNCKINRISVYPNKRKFALAKTKPLREAFIEVVNATHAGVAPAATPVNFLIGGK
jgi:hypothetical protein